MHRTIIGNLADDPTIVEAGQINITKFRVIENTGEYRKGQWVADAAATTHYVEAKFDLGEHAAVTLKKGSAAIVYGTEHTSSWGPEGDKKYGRVIKAIAIGAELSHAIALISPSRKTPTADPSSDPSDNQPATTTPAPSQSAPSQSAPVPEYTTKWSTAAIPGS